MPAPRASSTTPDRFICSFCGKDKDDVRCLLAGLETQCLICDACVRLCAEILNENNAASARTPERESGKG